MIIRRSFNFCAAHIVRNCTSGRCSKNLHGHNYLVEIFVSANHLDSAGMILDFGIFKNQIADFIDGFDHAHHLWNLEDQKIIDFATHISERYVILSHNPSAESYALLFLFFITKFLQAMHLGNNEGELVLESVRIHETDHGYAEAFRQDLENQLLMKNISLDSIYFSSMIQKEWKDPQMLEKLKSYHQNPTTIKPFIYQTPPHQVKL